MGKKANPALIGAFVVGAIALAVVGVLVFGSGRLFKHTLRCVCFFPGTVNGLSVGAPVKFKGVEIGQVADIRIRLTAQGALNADQVAEGIRIPVFIDVDTEKVVSQGGKDLDADDRIKQLIDLGLRAQLNAQSIVTGLLFVELGFHPDLEPTFILPPGSDELEIPTIPTSLERIQSAAEEILQKIDDMHLEIMVQSASDALDGLKNLVQSPAVKQTVESLPETVANINQTLASVRELSVRLDRGQGPLLASLKETSDKTGATVEEMRETLQTVQRLIGPDSPLAGQLSTSLQEFSGAARSLRLLADMLDRNPSALLRGRKDENAK